jgi:hypothetical protein
LYDKVRFLKSESLTTKDNGVYTVTEQKDRQIVICERLIELGYAQERHIRLYGEEFYLLSNPIPDGDGFSIDGVARRSGSHRRIRVPLSIVVTIQRQLAALENQIAA